MKKEHTTESIREIDSDQEIAFVEGPNKGSTVVLSERSIINASDRITPVLIKADSMFSTRFMEDEKP